MSLFKLFDFWITLNDRLNLIAFTTDRVFCLEANQWHVLSLAQCVVVWHLLLSLIHVIKDGLPVDLNLFLSLLFLIDLLKLSVSQVAKTQLAVALAQIAVED